MNIYIITGDLSNQLSGVYDAVVSSANEFSKMGHNVIVFCSSSRLSDSLNFSITKYNIIGPSRLYISTDIVDLISVQALKPDIVVFHGIWMGVHVSVSRWCRLNLIPYLCVVHGNFNNRALAVSSVKKIIATKLIFNNFFKYANGFIALTDEERFAIKNYLDKPKTYVLPNGIYLRDRKRSGDKKILHQKFRLDPAKKYALFIGRFDPIKGIERLLNAWEKYGSDKDWILVIAGDGPSKYFESILRLANSLSNNVLFLGPLIGDDKWIVLRNADFLVMSSYSEGLPIVALESMSVGVSVLLTEECGLSIVEERCAGMIWKTSHDGLGDTIKSMMYRNNVEKDYMSSNAHNLARDVFSWNVISKNAIEIFHKAIESAT